MKIVLLKIPSFFFKEKIQKQKTHLYINIFIEGLKLGKLKYKSAMNKNKNAFRR